MPRRARHPERPFARRIRCIGASSGMVLMLLAGCATGPKAEEGVAQAMADQAEAWNRGDVLGFMDSYADSVRFISPSGTTVGKRSVTANYIRRYPDPDAMGHLLFTDLEILPVGSDHAWCTGNWQLQRQADTLRGGFTLLWRQDAQGWSILRDHTY